MPPERADRGVSATRRVSSWGSRSARPATRRSAVADGQALLGPGHRLVSGSDGLAQGGEVASHLVQALLEGGGALRVAGGGGHGPKPRLEPVDGVLDALEPLGDRAQPAGNTLDVGCRRDVERPHRGLLGLHGLLARLEGAGERAVHHGVADQLLRDAAKSLLTLPREAVDEALVVLGVVHHRQPNAPPPDHSYLTLNLSFIRVSNGA